MSYFIGLLPIRPYHSHRKSQYFQNHIPHGLQPRTQLKQQKKCRKVSIPYVDHLTQHLSELKAQSICTIIEPRDPKTFRISNTSTTCSEQSVTPQRLDMPVREQAPLQQLPSKNKTADTIRSSTIDQQKEKLSDYLSGVEMKRQNSKASFLYPKREKSHGNCSPVTKKLGETAGVRLALLTFWHYLHHFSCHRTIGINHKK